MEMMKKRRKSILLLATMGVFLINGCGAKEEVQEIPSEAFVNEKQETQTTQMPPVKEVKYMDIAHVFKPYEQAVEISLQMPEDWNYTLWDVEEESPDWGYSVKVQGREDAIFSIFGQHGTLTDDSSNGPKSFQTSQGLTGQYSWDEYTLDDGNPAIQGTIIFDTELLAGFYGVSFNMPKSIYSENKDIIDKVFQSISIKEAQ